MSELNGQMDLGDILPREEAQTPAAVAGYDAYDENGALLDYVPNGTETTADVYAAIDEGDADRLRYLAAGIRSDFDGARERVLHMGMLLMEARNRCPAGRWLQWLNAEARVPERTAQQAMQLYETFGAKELPENITVSHLVELLRAPEDDRDSLMEKAADEGLSTRELKAEVKQLQDEYRKAQVSIHDLHVELEEANRVKDRLQSDVKSAEAERDRRTKQAEDAVKRANKADEKRRKAEGQVAELMAREPETIEVEKIPDDVAAELEHLRAENETLKNGKPRSPLVEQFVYLVRRFNASFGELTDQIDAIMAEDEPKAAECLDTLKKLVTGMRAKLGD